MEITHLAWDDGPQTTGELVDLILVQFSSFRITHFREHKVGLGQLVFQGWLPVLVAAGVGEQSVHLIERVMPLLLGP